MPAAVRRLPVLVAALLVVVAVRSAEALDKARLAEIGPLMQGFVDQQEIAGAVTVVGRREGIVHFEAVGKRDLASGAALSKQTLFRIASMTKPITALAVMILAEEGKLAVDDPVEKHLPEFRGKMLVVRRDADGVLLKKPPRPITLRDLLTHTSGLGGMPEGLADLYVKRNHTLAEAVMALSQRPLEFEPGSKWTYCNAGIDTLGRIVEVLGQMPYEEFLRRRIFAPLGMNDTTFYPNDEQWQRTAVLYEKVDGKLSPVVKTIGQPQGARHPIPAGGLFSTGGDLARLYRMFLKGGAYDGGRLVAEKTVADMTRLQTGELKCGFVDAMGFGLGFGVVRQPLGVTAMLSPGTFGHGGAFGTQGWMDPKQDLFVILLIQRAGLKNGDASEMRRALQEAAVAAIRG